MVTERTEQIRNEIIERLKTVYDPEIPVNIFDLGLIYNIDITENICNIDMTLTSPGCPVAEELVFQVHCCGLIENEIEKVNVNLTWTPCWTPDMMSLDAKLFLGID